MRNQLLTAPLGSLAEIVMGQSPPGDTYNDLGEGLPLLNGPTEFGETSPSATIYTTDARRMAKKGDILFCVRGSTTGRMNWADREYAIGRGIAALRAKTDADIRYLRACLDDQLPALLQRAGGSTFPNLSFRDVATFPVPSPPLVTQQRIAAILTSYELLIRASHERINLLEEAAQRVYQEWFVDFRCPGYDHADLVDSELGQIPESWSVKTIGDIAAHERYGVTSGPFGSKLGTKDYVPDGVPVIRGANLAIGGAFRDSGFVFVSEQKADELKSSLAHPGDLVVTQRGTLGQVGLLREPARYRRYVISQSQMKITVDPSTGSNEYLYAAMRSPEVTQRLQDHAIVAGVPHINLGILRGFRLIWPDAATQDKVTMILRPIGELVGTLVRTIETAHAVRDILMPRLIRGEIDVSGINTTLPEEPA